jgi:MshEN domain
VTVELARRLMRSGVVSEADVEAALLDAVTRDVAFVSVLAEQSPVLAQLIERELGRVSTPSIRAVRAVPELSERVPAGMCARLLAVPVREDSRTGTVDIAAVDPLDPQVATEFVFQLGVPVRILRAPLLEVTAAIEALDSGPASPRAPFELHDDRTPAFGTPVTRPSSAPPPRQRVSMRPPAPSFPPVGTAPSQPPIPLVRSLPARSRRGTNPGVGSVPPPPVDLAAEDEAGEPVIGLFRAKAASLPDADPRASSRDDIGLALMGLAAAESADAVVEQLVQGIGPVARHVIVFAPHGPSFEARAARPRPAADLMRRLRVPVAPPSVFVAALDAGYYLGRLPQAPGRAELLELLDGADDEVYVLPVLVSTRPALVAVMSGFESAFSATRRADQLGEAASQALERIVRAKKRGR